MNILELYKQGKTINEVSKITGIHRSSIYRSIKKDGIVRSMSEASKGKKLSESHKLNISKGLGNSPEKIGSPRKVLKKGYDKITKELAYITGVLMGDGYLTKDGIGLETIDKEFADEFARCVEKQFNLKPSIYYYKKKPMVDWRNGKTYQRKPTYTVRQRSILMHKYLVTIDNLEFVDNLSRELRIVWLRGVWDSDGSLDKRSGQVLFYNKYIDLIELYQKLLLEIDIPSKYYQNFSTNVYRCYFARRYQQRFFEIVKPTIKRKVLNTSFSN